VLDTVSENLPFTLLAVRRNGSSFSQVQINFILNKLRLTRVAELLAISTQITLEGSIANLARCLKSPRQKKMNIKKEYIYIFVHIRLDIN
jgi:hypothetical protein